MLLLNLTGKRIRRIKPDSVEFEDGKVIDLTRRTNGRCPYLPRHLLPDLRQAIVT
jgi:hypothetical protein